MNKFLSRKFILAFSAQVIASLVLFLPDHADQVSEIVTSIAGVVLSVGTALGYIVSETKIDVASVEKAKEGA